MKSIDITIQDEDALEMMKKTPDIKFVLTHLQ